METKKFTVVDTRSNRIESFESTATTLAELKRDLAKLGIDTYGMSIQEGLTKIELVDDAAILPHDVNYKGTVTNNLVFRLTQNEKRVKSGMTRKEAYGKIKSEGLAQAVLAKFGKSYTNCSTEDLVNFIEGDKKADSCACCEALEALVDYLCTEGCLTCTEANDVLKVLGKKSSNSSDYTATEIEEMFKYM